MVRFTDEWLNELLDKNDIVDVIGGYLPLNKRGANYWAKCPWHAETRPSFSVTPSKRMFYCFSCRKGGSVINFLMEYEKLSYPEAVQKLADRVGMDMPQNDYDPNYKQKLENIKRLRALMVDTAHYFHDNLKTQKGAAGLEYFKKRGIATQIGRFGLGYALGDFDDLVKHLKSRGYTVKEMLDAGVAKQKGANVYDTFRDRAMFPIIDVSGNVIAFGGRIIAEGEPKYLNSPETLLFNKRKNLYNLFRVKKEHDLKAIILTEGYMDVVALGAAGINVAVASLGTALSEDQARLIKRYCQKVYLCYDGDEPGIKAAIRACDILSKVGLSVYVIRLPEGLDPDEIIKKYGVARYRQYVKEAVPAFEFKLNMLKRGYDLSVEEDLMQYAKEGAKLIRQLPEGVERDRYVKYLSVETSISEATLAREVAGGDTGGAMFIPAQAKTKAFSDPEDKLISLLIQYPAILEQTDIIKEDVFGNELYRKIFIFMNDKIKRGFSANCAEIISVFSEQGLDASLVAEKTIPADISKIDEIKGLLKEIEIRRSNNKVEELKKAIENAEGSERIRLLGELNSLNVHLQSLKRMK